MATIYVVVDTAASTPGLPAVQIQGAFCYAVVRFGVLLGVETPGAPFLGLQYVLGTLSAHSQLVVLAVLNVLFEKKYYRPMLHNHFTTLMRPVSNQLEPCVSRGTRDIAGWTVGCQLSTILTDALCSSTPARTMQS